MTYFTIHHSSPAQTVDEIYYKGKVYSLSEYIKLLQRKHNIKECFSWIIFMVIIILRAHMFLILVTNGNGF